MPSKLDRLRQWCRDLWERNICAECPRDLDLEEWWSTEGSEPQENVLPALSNSPPAKAGVGAGVCGHSHVEGVFAPRCEYPTCTETSLNGVAITSVRSKHRTYCCELHAAFALLEIARNDVPAWYSKLKSTELILALAARSLAGELVTTMGQSDIDREVEHILSS